MINIARMRDINWVFALVQTEPIGHWGGIGREDRVLSRLKFAQGSISVVVSG